MPDIKSMGAGSVTVDAMSFIDFWSDIDDLITLTTATENVVLPDVVVADIPATDTVKRVIGMLRIRELEDSSAAENAVNGAVDLKVKKSTGAWGTDDVALINIPDNALLTPASGVSRGTTLFGDNDVVSEVDGDATYNFRLDGNVFVDGNNLLLRDVQVGVRVYFS